MSQRSSLGGGGGGGLSSVRRGREISVWGGGYRLEKVLGGAVVPSIQDRWVGCESYVKGGEVTKSLVRRGDI